MGVENGFSGFPNKYPCKSEQPIFSRSSVNRVQPYSQRWTFDVQRTFFKEFLLDAAYVGNKAIHLPVDRNINATLRYYRIGEDRRRDAVDKVTAMAFDRCCRTLGVSVAASLPVSVCMM